VSAKLAADDFVYSAEIKGDDRNWNWSAQFDKSGDGYVGITQTRDGTTDRVLLSPAQVRALLKFIAK